MQHPALALASVQRISPALAVAAALFAWAPAAGQERLPE
jgi:hypothetical protein